MYVNVFQHFLQLRQLGSETNRPLDVVSPRRIGGGNENECYGNAFDLARQTGWKLCSGWLYLRLDESVIQFTQHWWNVNSESREFFDCSPSLEEAAIHVLDENIALFVTENISRLSSHVCSSVLWREQKFFLLDYGEVGIEQREAQDLSNTTLYSRYLKDRVGKP